MRLDRGDRQKSLHLLLPGPGLVVGHAERDQFFPQSGLEPADLQRAVRGVLQCPGFLDQAGEPPQLGLVQAEVGTVGQQQVGLTAVERDEHIGERDLAALDRDRDPEVEPVDLACYLAGGQADAQRIARLAVVRGFPADLDGDPGLAVQQRQQFGGEPHGVQAAEPGAGDQGAVAEQSVAPEAVENRLLGHPIPVPGIAGYLLQPGPEPRVADLVGPLPVELDLVAVTIRRAEHQRRVRDGRRDEGAIGGDQRGGLPQSRVERLAKPGLPRGGHLKPLTRQRHGLQLRRNGAAEPGQPEPPAGGIGAPPRFGRLEVDQAVAPGADEPDRDRAFGRRSADAEHRGDDQPAPGLVLGDIQAEFRIAVPLDRTKLAPVHQRQAGLLGLIEQRPEPLRLERGQLDRPLVAVGVVIGLAGTRPVQREQLPQELELRPGAVREVAVAFELAPAPRAADPAAVLAGLHQPCHQPH